MFLLLDRDGFEHRFTNEMEAAIALAERAGRKGLLLTPWPLNWTTSSYAIAYRAGMDPLFGAEVLVKLEDLPPTRD